MFVFVKVITMLAKLIMYFVLFFVALCLQNYSLLIIMLEVNTRQIIANRIWRLSKNRYNVWRRYNPQPELPLLIWIILTSTTKELQTYSKTWLKYVTETVVCGRTTVMVWRFYVLSFRYDVEYVPTQDVS